MSTDLQIGLFIAIGAVFSLFVAAVLIRRPIANVRSISERLISDSLEVGAAVSQIFSISQELSSASGQQASAVQETAASIEEISSMARKSADNAESSRGASAESNSSAERGKLIVSRMVSSMSEINRGNDSVSAAVAKGNERIAEIVKVIQEIGQKTQVINEIVFQTKLLSFNASVEAARAGVHGKGFAVVAEEVGNLARMSGQAAEEITRLLSQSVEKAESIARETKERVDTLMTDSKASVERGAEVAGDCETVLTEIVNASSEVSRMISDIVSASQEQSRGVTEISRAIQQIDQATQVGARSASSCATAASQLAIKVKELKCASSDLRMIVDGKSSVTRFIWGREFELGIDSMDQEHKTLIEKMNRLAEEMENFVQSGKSGSVHKAFLELAGFTRKHFADEERYLESIDYPELKGHREIHRELLEKVGSFERSIETGSFNSEELMGFLNDWLMRHILGVDMKYAKFSRTRGREVRNAA